MKLLTYKSAKQMDTSKKSIDTGTKQNIYIL